MTDTAVYFGKPGSQIEIPHPRGGVQAPRTRPTTTFTTGTGGMRANRSITGKRQYTLAWQRLFYESFAEIEAFHHGHNGPGPFVLHDPGQRNWLTVNQSAATSHLCATDEWSLAASGSNLSSSATAYYRGPRSLMWDFVGGLAASGQLTADPPSPIWPGIPVMEGLALCFALRAKKTGSAGATLTARLAWLDEDGVSVSNTDGTPLALTTDWQQFYTTATPPAGAFYVLCQVLATSADSGAVMHLDVPQLERGSVAQDWRPGTGVYPVTVVSLLERWPWQAEEYRENVTLVLQEVGE